MNIDIEKMDRLRYLKKNELKELLAHYKLMNILKSLSMSQEGKLQLVD